MTVVSQAPVIKNIALHSKEIAYVSVQSLVIKNIALHSKEIAYVSVQSLFKNKDILNINSFLYRQFIYPINLIANPQLFERVR